MKQGWTDDEADDPENLLALCEECNLGMGANPLPIRLVLGAIRSRLTRTK